jgi:hypothetical protein
MRNTILSVSAVLLLMLGIAGCKDSVTDGNLLGNNTNTVNFTMGVQQSTNGVQFTWNPSVNVIVTKLVLSTTGFKDSIIDNSGQTYTAGQQWAYPNEYTGVTSGQQWQFIFSGSTPSNSQAFTSTVNYTIP